MKAQNATFKKNKLPDDAKNKLFFLNIACATFKQACTGGMKCRFVHQGSKLYRETFTKVFCLEQQMRQQGQGEDDMRFAAVLAHLRVGEVTMEDWRFI